MTISDDPVLFPKEVAAELRVHYRTVLDYIHTGRLHAVKQGKHYFIRRSELERFKGGPAPVPAAV